MRKRSRWHLTGTGQRIRCHRMDGDCDRLGCVIHSPTPTPISSWPTHWRDDAGFMERICPHGVGWPDLDEDAYFKRNGLPQDRVFGTCGHTECHNAYREATRIIYQRNNPVYIPIGL